MYRRTIFRVNIVIAIFILTWSPDFIVKGEVKSRHELCVEYGYDAACQFSSYKHPCKILDCGRAQNIGGHTLYRLLPRLGVPDGTMCGPSHICMNTQCVHMDAAPEHCSRENNFVSCKRHRIRNVPKTREGQCKDIGFDVACTGRNGAHRNCADLLCGYKISNGTYVRHPTWSIPLYLTPSTGSWCGDGKFCYHEKCVSESQIPPSLPKRPPSALEPFHSCRIVQQ